MSRVRRHANEERASRNRMHRLPRRVGLVLERAVTASSTGRKIGSSDCGACAALYEPSLAYLAKQRTAGDVWLRLVHGIEWKGNKRTDRGLEMEPALAELYEQEFGEWYRPVPWGEKWVIQHPSREFATCSPDAFGDDVIVELKTQSQWARPQWGDPGTDEVPDSYAAQCQWLLACTQRDTAHVVVAFGADTDEGFAVVETAFYRVDADAELQHRLLACGERFWTDFVVTKQPPFVKPDANRVAWKEKLRANGIDPKDPRFVDLKRKRKDDASAHARTGEGAGANQARV